MSRRDDELMDVPSIVPDTEGRNTREPIQRAPAKTPRSDNSTAPSSGIIRQALSILAFMALSIFCALFYYENAQQKLLNEQLQNRLGLLETQLGVSNGSNTGSESLTNKVQDLGKDLKAANDDIHKLSTASDKNKKLLDSHESKIAEHDKNIDTLQSTATELKKSVAQTEKTAGDANRSATESNQAATDATKAIAEIRSAVGTLQQRISQGDPQVREASQQAAMAQEQSEQLQTKVDALAKHVTDHDESLRSIDYFRRSVSSDLSKLKGQSLEQVPGQPPH